MGSAVSWHYDGPVDCELLGGRGRYGRTGRLLLCHDECLMVWTTSSWKRRDDLRVDKSGTMFLGKIGDNVGAVSR